jgi:hypothetical protein
MALVCAAFGASEESFSTRESHHQRRIAVGQLHSMSSPLRLYASIALIQLLKAAIK